MPSIASASYAPDSATSVCAREPVAQPSGCGPSLFCEIPARSTPLFRRMYRRNLPHCYPEGAAVFVTWRLFGALPPQKSLEGVKDGRAFAALDRTMDRAQSGPAWLREPGVAEVVSKILEAADAERNLCRLHSFVVMPNHVHMLITPYRSLRQVTNWIKGVSAREANQALNPTGQRFWQDESFDHWARSVQEFEKIERYIHENPVRAGLVREAVDWRFSSAGRSAQTRKGSTTTA